MQLKKIEIAPENDLKHEMFCVPLPSTPHSEVLIVKFSGVCGVGCQGNGDARYMTAMVKAAVSFTAPVGLIFDFSGLDYQWGDMMGEVLCAGDGRYANSEMPSAVVVSASCEKAIRSLLTAELGVEDLSMVCHSIESALAHVDEKNKLT